MRCQGRRWAGLSVTGRGWDERAWPIAKPHLGRALETRRDPGAGALVELTFVPAAWPLRQTIIAIFAALAVASGCATCSPDDLASRAQWGAPLAVVDQSGFVYRADVFPAGPWSIPSVRTWGVPCRLPESARNIARPCTPAEMTDPNGPVCYLWRYP